MKGGERVKIIGGFGSAGAGSRSGRRIMTRGGLSTTAKERDRRKEKAARNVKFDDNPPKDILKNYIDAGRCYWCDDGRTFKSLSQHWRQAHGIAHQWVRDYLLLPKSYSFICEETKALYSENGKRNYDQTRLKAKGGPHKMSEYGKLIQRKKALAWAEKLGPEGYKEHLSRLKKASEQKQTNDALEKRKNNPAHCIICGKELDWPLGKCKPKTCGGDCLMHIRGENMEKGHKKRDPIPCIVCGKEFVPPNSHRKTCGDGKCIHHLQSLAAKESASWKLPLANKARIEKLKNMPPKMCTINGCNTIQKCKGLCSKHYQQAKEKAAKG